MLVVVKLLCCRHCCHYFAIFIVIFGSPSSFAIHTHTFTFAQNGKNSISSFVLFAIVLLCDVCIHNFFFFARKRDRESLLNRKSYKFGWETKSVWGFLMNYPFVGELVKEWRSVSYPFNIVFSTYIYIYRIRCRKVHIFMLWGGCGRTRVLVYACKRSLSFVFILFFSSVEHIHADTHIAQCASFLSQPLLLFYFNFYSLFLPL